MQKQEGKSFGRVLLLLLFEFGVVVICILRCVLTADTYLPSSKYQKLAGVNIFNIFHKFGK